MCGIAGLIRREAGDLERDVRAMVGALRHRGPDDEGHLVHENAAIGMRRLAVIDLSPAGHQPMGNEDGAVQLVFNGEIYNFEDLRVRLEAQGHTFRSRSDTEVLVHGYEAFGVAGLARQLEGMFAIAILDRRTRQLHLARGPFGIKPLYLRRTAQGLSFASELRALAHDGQGPLAPGDAWLGSYLRLGYVPSPQTVYRDVTRMEPGTALTVDLATLRETTARYHALRPRAFPSDRGEDLLEELNKLLGLSVRRQMVADVPVGIFLSGGLDSGIIAGMAARRARRSVRTFSIGFEASDRGDETDAAAQMAARIGTQHEAHRIDPADLGELDEIVAALEEPLADSAVVPLWRLCASTRARVTVALSGEGGDEVLGGYPRYFWGAVSDRAGTWPAAAAGPLQAVRRVLPDRSKGPLNVLRRAGKLAESAGLEEPDRYLAWFDLFTPAERESLAPHAGETTTARFHALFQDARDAGLDAVQRMQYVDFHTMLLDNLLAKSDRLSMAHSLEVRVPMLDRQLVEFGLGLPPRFKVSPAGGKVLLRKLMQTEFSRAAAQAPKRGFEIPVDHWFRRPEAAELREKLPHGSLVKKLGLRSEGIRALIARHQAGEDLGRKLFALLTLGFWARRFA